MLVAILGGLRRAWLIIGGSSPTLAPPLEEKPMPEENPMTEAWHLYPQPWDPILAQNKHHSGDSERTQKDRSSPATSCEANRRPPGAESILPLSPDRGETERPRPHCSNLGQTEEGWRSPSAPLNEGSAERLRWGPVRTSLPVSEGKTLLWCCPRKLPQPDRTEGPETHEDLSVLPATPDGWPREETLPPTRDLSQTGQRQKHPNPGLRRLTRTLGQESERPEKRPPQDDPLHTTTEDLPEKGSPNSHGIKTESSWKSQLRLRASWKALFQSRPSGTRCVSNAGWPRRTIQNFADCNFEDRNSSAIEKNFFYPQGSQRSPESLWLDLDPQIDYGLSRNERRLV